MKRFLPLLMIISFCSFGQKDTTRIKPLSSNSQLYPFINVIPPSPEASSIGRYGELPVSLSSGTTSTPVMMYVLKSGSLQVPISLSNHSSGIRANEVSSTVGSGWSLQAGGAITRSVKGWWDECSNGILNITIPEESQTTDFSCFKGDVESDRIDGQPDDFFYNFNSSSGKFIFNTRNISNQTISPVAVTYPNSNLKIDFVGQSYFVVTDADGTIYKFEDIETTTLVNSDRPNTCGNTYTSTWYLSKIISSNRIDTVSFIYTTPVSISSHPVWSTTLQKTVKYNGAIEYTYSYGVQQTSVSSIFLSSIVGKNGKVTFSYATDRLDHNNSDAKRLTEVKIYQQSSDGTFGELRKYQLSHSYFSCSDGYTQAENPQNNINTHPSNSYLRKRLRLDSVQEVSSLGVTIPSYQFQYYETQPLAIYGSMAQDYWGYSNGASGNTNLLIKNTNGTAPPSTLYGANRVPSFSYAVSGALKRITYPTGGYSEIEYEPNILVNNGTTVQGGGIRVKKLINQANIGGSTQIVYDYVKPYFTNNLYQGSMENLGYEMGITRQIDRGSCDLQNETTTIYPENVSFSLGSNSGSSIAYEEVESYQTDSLGSRIGKKKYTYRPYQDQISGSFPYFEISASWRRGELLNEKSYKRLDNGIEVLLQEQITNYTTYSSPYKSRGYLSRLIYEEYVGACKLTPLICNKYPTNNAYNTLELNEQSLIDLPTQIVTYTYDQDGNNAVVDTVDRQYNTTYLLLTTETHGRSRGGKYTVNSKYPFDYSGNSVYDEMVNRHIYSPVIESEQKENTTSLKIVRTNYKQWYPSTNIGGVNGFYAPFSVETQENGGSFITELVMGESLSNPTQNGYDVKARPILYTDKSTLNTTFDWWDETGKRGFLKQKTAGGQTIQYDYENEGRLKQITAPNGLISRFIYDSFGRLSLTKDHDNNKLSEYEYIYADAGNSYLNRVTTKQYRFPLLGNKTQNEPDYTTTHVYLDGLGRQLQTIGETLSPTAKDIVLSNQTYDKYGRVNQTLAVFPTINATGGYVSNGLSMAQSFYGDASPDVISTYENSPLNRVRSVDGLGSAWRGAGKKTQLFDESAGTDVRNYTIDASGNITFNGSYPANSLYKKRTIDEQGNATIEITDKQGRLVQRQQQVGSDWLTTYYINDGLGRVLAVLQPHAYALNSSISQGSADWSNGVFFYKYDNRGRTIEKHIPNGGFSYMVYDKADREVLMQDAHQRTLNQWSFTKYDNLSRVVISGELTNNASRTGLQSQFDSHSTLSESFNSSLPSQLYYTNVSFPFSVDSSRAMQVNYYDAYNSWRGASFQPTKTYYTDATGLLTGKMVRYTENRKWLTEAFYHDTKNRVTESRKQDVIGNVESLVNVYRFLGGLLSHTHLYEPQYFGSGGIYLSRIYAYDRGERRIKGTTYLSPTMLKYDDITIETNYAYNEIGQLANKRFQPNRKYQIANMGQDYIYRPPVLTEPNTQDIANRAVIISPGFSATASDVNTNTYVAEIDTTHSNGLTDGMQTIDYGYHIRGLVNCINCRNKQVYPNPKENDFFSMKLDFEDDKRYYDGNISRQTWKTPQIAKKQVFTHSYDGASRLTKSAYSGGVAGSNYSLDSVAYDRNGNIQLLKRHGIDNLTYAYNGNQLLSVSDAATTAGFSDGNTSGNDYGYWANGDLKYDKNKGIDSIVYHSYLKRVSRVKWANGNSVNFYYDGAGTLLKRKLSNGDTWMYRGDLLMKNDTLYQVNHDEGRVTFDKLNQKWITEFDYRDIQGNLRVSFRDSLADPVNNIYKPPVVVQVHETDPFGLQIDALSYENAGNNPYKFQNQLKVNDYNLGWNFFKYRYSDESGRFWQIDPLAEKYLYNSPYALQENKFGRGVELEGSELEEFDKTPRFPWHEPQKQPSQNIEKPKIEIKNESSIGVQGGIEGKLLGLKAGFFLNLGSIKMSDFSVDLSSEESDVKNNIDDNVTFEQEISGGIGVVGGMYKTSHSKNQNGDETFTREYGGNVGPFEVNFTDSKTTSTKGKTSNSSTSDFKMGSSAIRGGIVGKVGVEGSLVIPMTGVKSINYSSTDATRVDNSNNLRLQLLKR